MSQGTHLRIYFFGSVFDASCNRHFSTGIFRRITRKYRISFSTKIDKFLPSSTYVQNFYVYISRLNIHANTLPSPAHPAGFSFCTFTGFFVIFNVVTSNNFIIQLSQCILKLNNGIKFVHKSYLLNNY